MNPYPIYYAGVHNANISMTPATAQQAPAAPAVSSSTSTASLTDQQIGEQLLFASQGLQDASRYPIGTTTFYLPSNYSIYPVSNWMGMPMTPTAFYPPSVIAPAAPRTEHPAPIQIADVTLTEPVKTIETQVRKPEASRLETTVIETTTHQPEQTVVLKTSSPIVDSVLAAKSRPVDVSTEETATVEGHTGYLANRADLTNWRGPLPLEEYPINHDPNPELIIKRIEQPVVYKQEVAVRLLRPVTPEPHGDIVIRHDKDLILPPAPPILLRQIPTYRPRTPEPEVIRESPPPMPRAEQPRVVIIKGRTCPPPPRKVIIERLPRLPEKPRPIIIERWLRHGPQRRRVIYEPCGPLPEVPREKNVIIEWEMPRCVVQQEIKDLGVVRADPREYINKYGDSLIRTEELPEFVKELRLPAELVTPEQPRTILEGDVQALRLIDLDREGLSEYRGYVQETVSTQRPEIEVESELITETPSTSVNLEDLLSEVIRAVGLEKPDRVAYDEAKSIIARLNQKLMRLYDDEKADRFLRSIHLSKDHSVLLETFRLALLGSPL